MKKWLILSHRYLAMVVCVPLVVWFASGITMIYTGGMPRLTPADRLRRLDAIDLGRVRVSPREAAARAGDGDFNRVILLTVTGRPAYRFYGADNTTIFADTGERLRPVDADAALRVAGSFLGVPAERLRYDTTLRQIDQWTIGLGRDLPLHKINVGGGDGTEVYVSASLGEVVMMTDRRNRALAWIAAIPHWFYVTPLRANDRLWRWVVLAVSAAAIVVTGFGLMLAIVQYRSRYIGLMRWHYRAGALFGAFAVTWVFSGWLSMQPWNWAGANGFATEANRALRGGPLALGRFPSFDAGAWRRVLDGREAKEIELSQLNGKPQYVASLADVTRVVASGNPLDRSPRMEPAAIVARLREAFAGVPIGEPDLLNEYDSYYRDRDRRAPLPVVRVKCGDAERTWLYVDLATGDLAAEFTRRQRIERWAYHGLHSLDFPFWYDKRPLWDIAVIVLCCGGLALSIIGTVLAARRAARRWKV